MFGRLTMMNTMMPMQLVRVSGRRSVLESGRSVVARRYFASDTNRPALTAYHEVEDGKIGYLTLNNPSKRNALSLDMLEELRTQFKSMKKKEKLRAIILRANGPVFSSGHDLKEINQAKNGPSAKEFYEKLFSTCSDVMLYIRKLPQPVIAQVSSLATAAGCQLVASCDLVVATEKAAFQTPGVKIGLFCTTPGVAVARHINSTKKTMEMLLTGDAISAHEALSYGLVNKVVAEEELEKETLKMVHKIIATPPNIIALGKKAFYEQITLKDVGEAYSVAEEYMCENLQLEQSKEGITAFVEKRHPKWD